MGTFIVREAMYLRDWMEMYYRTENRGSSLILRAVH